MLSEWCSAAGPAAGSPIAEDELREDLSKFGPIDTVKIMREKAIGFVHFLSIGDAIKAVARWKCVGSLSFVAALCKHFVPGFGEYIEGCCASAQENIVVPKARRLPR
jgi:hypothetical protein